MAVIGRIGAVYAVDQTVAAIAFTDEATTADATKTRYSINNHTKRYWSDTDTITVKKNGVVQTTGFTVEKAGGVVVFDSPLTSETVLVSGKYLTVTQVASVFDWNIEAQRTAMDITAMGDSWATKMPSAVAEWSAGWSAYYIANSARNFNFAGAVLIGCFYTDSANDKRYEGYIAVEGWKGSNATGEVVSEALTAAGHGPVYYHEG